MNLLARLGLARPTVAASNAAPITPGGTGSLAAPWAPESHLQSVVVSELAGLHYRPVTREMGMRLPALAKARNLLCATGARLPLIAHDETGARVPAPFVSQPERGRPALVTYTWIIDALIWWGQAWLVVTERYADDARPRFAQWVPAWHATTDNAGRLTEAFGRPVAQRDVIRIDAHHEGLLSYAGDSLREAEAIARATLNAARNPVPSIELHQTGGEPMNREEISELRAQWARARQGEHGGVAYTNQSVEAKPHGQAADQLLLGARNAIALDLARLAGVPAWLVDATTEGTSLTYSTVPSRSREFIDYGLLPYLDAIAGRLSMDDVLPRGQWARHDTGGLLRASFADRMSAYKAALDSGVYTADELRQMEHETPRESTR